MQEKTQKQLKENQNSINRFARRVFPLNVTLLTLRAFIIVTRKPEIKMRNIILKMASSCREIVISTMPELSCLVKNGCRKRTIPESKQ